MKGKKGTEKEVLKNTGGRREREAREVGGIEHRSSPAHPHSGSQLAIASSASFVWLTSTQQAHPATHEHTHAFPVLVSGPFSATAALSQLVSAPGLKPALQTLPPVEQPPAAAWGVQCDSWSTLLCTCPSSHYLQSASPTLHPRARIPHSIFLFLTHSISLSPFYAPDFRTLLLYPRSHTIIYLHTN